MQNSIMFNLFSKRKSFSWLNPKLEVRDTGLYGKGVFAKEGIGRSERLAVFGGYIMKISDAEKMPAKYADKGVQISEEFELTPGLNTEDADFFNHSCEPNAGFKGQIFLVPMRDIWAGEEITFDYAMVLHHIKDAEEYKMECQCGRGDCRKVVTENDWMVPEIQNKYSGYFQYHIQDKINNLI